MNSFSKETQIRTIGDKKVKRTNIIGTDCFVYSAYEPSSYTGNHSSLFSFDGQCHGAVQSRRLTAELAALPAMSHERYDRCTDYRQQNEREAIAYILALFPEAASGRVRDGEIVLDAA